MIVLKDGPLSSVLEEHHSLLHEQEQNQMKTNWGQRRQRFEWVNAIRYEYGPNAKKSIDIHVVVCREQWKEVDPDTLQIGTKENQHAWISSRALSRLNVHTRCNFGARYRWGIEGAFLFEKRQGYTHERAFAKHWNCHERLRKYILFCLSNTIPNPLITAVRPRAVSVVEFEDKFVISFLETPVEKPNQVMTGCIVGLRKG